MPMPRMHRITVTGRPGTTTIHMPLMLTSTVTAMMAETEGMLRGQISIAAHSTSSRSNLSWRPRIHCHKLV